MSESSNLISNLADIEDIHRIKGLYCDLIDRIRREGKPADVDRLAALFTEDAVLDFSSLNMGIYTGRTAIVEHFTKNLPALVTWMWHSVSSPIIEVSGDSAIGQWTLYSLADFQAKPSTLPPATYGRYTDTFKRVGGGWYQSSLYFLDETRR